MIELSSVQRNIVGLLLDADEPLFAAEIAERLGLESGQSIAGPLGRLRKNRIVKHEWRTYRTGHAWNDQQQDLQRTYRTGHAWNDQRQDLRRVYRTGHAWNDQRRVYWPNEDSEVIRQFKRHLVQNSQQIGQTPIDPETSKAIVQTSQEKEHSTMDTPPLAAPQRRTGSFASVLPALIMEGKEIRRSSEPRITYELDAAHGGEIWKTDWNDCEIYRHAFNFRQITAMDWQASKSYSFHRDEFEGSDEEYSKSLEPKRFDPEGDPVKLAEKREATFVSPILEPTALELSSKKQTSSAGRWWGKSVIYGKEDEHATPYMTRYWIGRLRFHIFHRGDQDPDCHDHPWDFWTFPLTPYVEEVVHLEVGKGPTVSRQVVPAWRLTHRPATHTHRVIGSAKLLPRREIIEGGLVRFYQDNTMRTYYRTNAPIVTLVWRGKANREWGFLKNREGKWCWVAWKEYVFGGGKSAPCE